jgi:prophage antirepressor-like protein
MTAETLIQKTGRYLRGESTPAEARQIQNWLSCTTDNNRQLTAEERSMLELEILAEVQAHTAYPLFHPKAEPWWKKITAFF